jgi:hypothetical protein
MSPRATGIGYPLYQCAAEKSGALAPMIKVTRYIANTFMANRALGPGF